MVFGQVWVDVQKASETAKPFFSRFRTKEAIRNLAYPEAYRPIVIYAGAGATIDRSGLSWKSMIDGLLELHISDENRRNALFENQLEVEVGTIARHLFEQTYGEGAEARLVDQLKLKLYGPAQWHAGLLLDALGELAKSWVDHRHVIFVTPNYDDYLLRHLTDLFPSKLRVLSPKLLENGRLVWEYRFRSAKKDVQEDGLEFPKGAVTLVQLHGLVESSPRSPMNWPPVVSEIDYLLTENRSSRALTRLFSGTDILMVGTSLRDGPLLRALHGRLQSNSDEITDCYAIATVGMHLGSESAERRFAQEGALSRMQAFDVSPIYVDYYVQIAQFVFELSRAVREAGGKVWAHLTSDQAGAEETVPYETKSLDSDSYGKRLDRWARDWGEFIGDDDYAYGVYIALTEALDHCRDQLDASDSEHLKLELWVRDRPSSRMLRLHSSTVAFFADDNAARRATIEPNSSIVAVRAFVSGGPLEYRMEVGKGHHQRWRGYIATPVWLPEDSPYGRLPVGCLVLASMRDSGDPSRPSCLFKESNSTSIGEVTNLLKSLGGFIAMGKGYAGEVQALLQLEDSPY